MHYYCNHLESKENNGDPETENLFSLFLIIEVKRCLLFFKLMHEGCVIKEQLFS